MNNTDITLADHPVIMKKMEMYDRTLSKLRGYLPVSYQEVCDNWGLQRIIERSFQILVEIMIDISHRIIALKGGQPTRVSMEALKKLQYYNIIRNHETYIRMVRFRNFLMHHSDDVSPSDLFEIMTRQISDFEQFKHEILSGKTF